MPIFPYTFPFKFGEQFAQTNNTTVVVTPSAGASVQKYADSSLSVSAGTSCAATKNAAAQVNHTVTASSSSVLSRGVFATSSLGVLHSNSPDSQELGFASCSTEALASQDVVASKGQGIDSALNCFSSASAAVQRVAPFSSHLAATITQTGYYGSPTAISPIKSNDFIETFNVKDETRWAGWETGPSVVNGQLVVPLDSSEIYSVGDINSGVGVLNLDTHQVAVHLVSPPTGSSTALARFSIRPEYGFQSATQAAICVDFVNGNWKFSQYDASGVRGSVTSTPYSSGEWVRVRLSGNVVYWDVSVDGLVWSNEMDEPVASVGYGASSVAFIGDSNGGSTSSIAVWDSLNSEPRAIQASLSVYALHDAFLSRDQLIGAELSSQFDQSGFNRYDAKAQWSLSLDMVLFGELMKTLNGAVSLDISHATEVDATEFGVADAALVLSADIDGHMVSDQIISAFTNATHSSAGLMSRGQDIDSDEQIYCYATSDGFCIYRTGSSLSGWVFPFATGLRDARASSNFAASIESEALATEFGIGESFLAVSFDSSVAFSKDQKIDASTYVGVARSGLAAANRFGGAALQAAAYGTGTLDEPFLIVTVPEDTRSADVAASPRSSIVKSDNRIAYVQDHKQKV